MFWISSVRCEGFAVYPRLHIIHEYHQSSFQIIHSHVMKSMKMNSEQGSHFLFASVSDPKQATKPWVPFVASDFFVLVQTARGVFGLFRFGWFVSVCTTMYMCRVCV